ncbi:minichromosome maintenance domain-containing protein 2 isoform X2 [Nilaparvata lugens]|nr:minichromosome maintenance domain-containing protein 2 isoform X2 [Nilaparvata lugens]
MGLKLGGCYQLTVTRDRGMTSLMAWGVQQLLPEPQSRLLSGLRLNQLPQSIQTLVHHLSVNCPRSSWALFAALSSQLAHQLAPMNCFLHLKAGILLSLASQCVKQEQEPCHLLCLGSDGVSVVAECARVARRLVAATGGCGVAAAGLYRVDEPSGSVWLEAGPLMLAAGGVCLLGDWHAYEKHRTSQIFNALENGEVCLDTQEYKKTTGSMPTGSPVHPVESAIWATCNYKYNRARKNANKALCTAIELFGMPFIGSCESMEEIGDFTVFKLSEASVNSGFNAKANLLVSEKDLREFLDIVSSKTVEISESAQNLLQRYFVDTRRARPGCLPAAAIKIMTALSEAHARIGLRDEVIENDALFVMALYEEALCAIYGPSMLTDSRPPKRPKTAHPIDIAEQTHENITEFAISIDRNLKCSSIDAGSHSNWLEE